MTCCGLRGPISAVTVPWVGAVLAKRLADGQKPQSVRETVSLLAPQVPIMIVSTDDDPLQFQPCGAPVVVSEYPEDAGMLLAALDWTKKNAWDTPWVVTIPAGWDRVPPDLVARLAETVSGSGAEAACVAEGGRLVVELGLWPVRLRQGLRHVIAASREAGREACITDWAREFPIAVTDLATVWHPAWCALPPAAPSE